MAKKKRSHTKAVGHSFEVGKQYQNREGAYSVVSIDEPNMVIRYRDGRTIESSIELQERIWNNIQENGSSDPGLELTP